MNSFLNIMTWLEKCLMHGSPFLPRYKNVVIMSILKQDCLYKGKLLCIYCARESPAPAFESLLVCTIKIDPGSQSAMISNILKYAESI
jgi:hypothetical protein